MINGKTILAIIPARGGSKGIPRKNIKILAGKPLIAWTIEEAKKSKYIDRLILSSEDEEIIKVAKKWGCEVPFVRPKELAKDDTPGIEPVIHAIKTLHENYDYVCLLQPTSPLRKVEHIDAAIELIIKMNAESLVSVKEVKENPYWMFEIDNNSFLNKFINENIPIRRQDLKELYVLNGAIYISKTDALIKNKSFLIDTTIAYKMDEISSVDIDEEMDFQVCEFLLQQKLKSNFTS